MKNLLAATGIVVCLAVPAFATGVNETVKAAYSSSGNPLGDARPCGFFQVSSAPTQWYSIQLSYAKLVGSTIVLTDINGNPTNTPVPIPGAAQQMSKIDSAYSLTLIGIPLTISFGIGAGVPVCSWLPLADPVYFGVAD